MNLDPAQWASVVSSLGSSAAAVVVVVCFVGYLKDRDAAEMERAADKGRVIEANTTALAGFAAVFAQHKEAIGRAMEDLSEIHAWCDRTVPDFVAYARAQARRDAEAQSAGRRRKREGADAIPTPKSDS